MRVRDMVTTAIREKLIDNGINNLKEFGYPDVDKDTILTDVVYRMFFKSMLKENIGNDRRVDIVLEQLIKEIDNVETNSKTKEDQ